MNQFRIWLCGLAASVACTASHAQTAEPHDSTFNALDHVLQRPAPARSFDAKRFGDHLFISAEGGPAWMRAHDGVIGGANRGYRAGITVGDWVTPVHGWRLGLAAGRHHGELGSQPYFVGLSADYLMNLSSLLRDDNPSRRFELIGVVGGEVQALHRDEHHLWWAGGLRIGLQPRLYFNRSTYLYIEPRLGMYTDALDDVKTWRHYDWQIQFMVGLGYRFNNGTGGVRIDNSLFVNDMFRNNLFAGVYGGAGMLSNTTDNLGSRVGVQGGAFIGKWFTAASGVRLQAGGGEIKEPGLTRRWDVMVDADYLLNLNSAMNGYDPDRRIDANVALGVTGAYLTGSKRHLFPGFHAGFQGVLNVSRNVGLFIEPQVRFFSKSASRQILHNRLAMYPSVTVGVIYRTRSTRGYNNAMRNLEDSLYRVGRHAFINFSGGVFQRTRGWVPSVVASFNFGSWFSPVSAWRLGVEAENYSSTPVYRSLSLTADYMASLSSLSGGYDPDRAVDLRAFIGLTGGAGRYNKGLQKIVWGGRAGLQAAIRLSDALDLTIEPQGQLLSIPDYRHAVDPEWRVLAGLTYKMGGRHQNTSKGQSIRVGDEPGVLPFVHLSFAPGFFSEGLSGNNISWTLNGAVGGWLSQTSGLQAFIDYDFAKVTDYDEGRIRIGTVGVDYMLNITTLMTGDRSERFNLVGLAGIGLAWSNRAENSMAPALHLGLQGRWRVAPAWELTLTPSLMGWTKSVLDNSRHSVLANASLAFGTAFSF